MNTDSRSLAFRPRVGCGGQSINVIMAESKKRGFSDVEDHLALSARARALDNALSCGNRCVGMPQMPWEVGYAGQVLSSSTAYWLRPPTVPIGTFRWLTL